MNECKVLARAWCAWGIAAFFYLYEMVLRVAPSVMTAELMSTFDVTSTMLGVVISCYYYSYTILQIPCGVILDRVGPKNLLSISAGLCVIGSALFAISTKLFVAQIGRFLVGAGSACAFVSCLQIATILFPAKHFPLIAGITNVVGTIGIILGGYPIAKTVNCYGWENTTFLLAGIGIIVIVLTFIFIPNLKVNQNKEQSSVFKTLNSIFLNKQILLAGMVAGLMYLPISAFSELWAIPFFMSKYHVNNEVASLAPAVLAIGIALGNVAMAIVARKLQSYTTTIRYCAFLITLLFIPLVFLNFGFCYAIAIVFAIGFFTGGQVINFTCAKNNAIQDSSGTTIAFTNGIVMLIGAIFQPALGVLLDYFWNGQISLQGMRIYDASCYKYPILSLALCLFIAYAMTFFMKETIQNEKD